jgi:4-carboxymuconolactone decarboxylase
LGLAGSRKGLFSSRPVYDLSRELLSTRAVSDPTYRRAVSELGQKSVVELVGILGYYTLISMTIKAFEVAVPEGTPEPFAGT